MIQHFTEVKLSLDEAVHGMVDVKEEIIKYVAQLITNPSSRPRVIGLQGEPGIGKTEISRNGVAKALKTSFESISLGGMKDSSSLSGHDYTYQGSKHGLITQLLISAKVMNPVIFLDELDKVAKWDGISDVEDYLIHITDPVQNHDYRDKYFPEVPVNLGSVFFIVAFNNQDGYLLFY